MSDDLDLTRLATEAIEEYRQERAQAVRNKIKQVLGRMAGGRGSVTQLERSLEKAKQRLAKEENKLQQLLSGNWSVLDSMDDPKEQPENDAKPFEPSVDPR